MHFNYYFLRHLTKALETKTLGMEVMACFTQNKNELILQFSAGADTFNIKSLFDGESSLIHFPESIHRAKKNSVDLFKELHGKKVTGLRQFQNERAFSIMFENGAQLIFKLHGYRANILLFYQNKLVSLFKNSLSKDSKLSLNQLDRPIDQSDQNLLASEFDLKSIFPTFDKNCAHFLESNGYDESGKPEKVKIMQQLLTALEAKEFYILKKDKSDLPYLSLLKNMQAECLFESNDPIEITNEYAHQYLSKYHFTKTKNKHLAVLHKKIKQTKSYIKSNEQKLSSLIDNVKYEELANILMANLHIHHDAASKQIELFDFYQDVVITIKLKPNVSLQKNAELYYRKAKNQHKQIDNLQKNMNSKQTLLAETNILTSKIASTTDLKTLRQLLPEAKLTASITQKKSNPFMTFYIDGFEVWVGRNAANNDLLTQKFARKDDLWLHARDVAGSHTVIRKKDKEPIPLHTIEKVAQLAAWYSKRRNDSLCPVIYTPKKYVRKPKGSYPGQVSLSREQVILVKPCQKVQ